MFSYYPRPFGRYFLLRRLAEGGMGALHLAATGQSGLEKLCVIKTVLPSRGDPEYMARFSDEAQVLLRLSHGNLVPILDVAHQEGQPYLAMEYVVGRDLRAVWNKCAERRMAFPIDVALHIVRELLRGLHYAHTVPGIQLVHRDVSPQNILLSIAGEVKLADFGLAKSTLSQVQTEFGVIYGKPQYMSPEQAKGQPLDARSDIYSAGIILWEMLTGRQLFPGSQIDAQASARENVRPPSSTSPRVPENLDPLVMTALKLDPQERYPDAEAMRGALASWLAQEAPTTDAARIARFLTDLYGDEILKEREDDNRLLLSLRQTVQVETPKPSPTFCPIEAGVVVDGRYKLARILGEGGVGQVWAAEHQQIGKQVAVKFLTSVHARGEQVAQAFAREARATSAIRHPNVVSVTDAGRYGDTLYLVMELLEGRTLQAELQKRGQLPPQLALHIAEQVAQTLAAAHEAGVIHRDLKPANIMLSSEPVAGGSPFPNEETPLVKVLDFGIALTLTTAEAQELVSSGRVRGSAGDLIAGTVDYMAPEQLLSANCDGRADVYALGVVLYEMLAGVVPRPKEPIPLSSLRPDLPPGLEALVLRALRLDKEERFPSMRDLALEIARLRQGDKPPASSPMLVIDRTGETPLAKRPPTRFLLVFFSILGALLTMLLLLLLWPGHPHPEGSQGADAAPLDLQSVQGPDLQPSRPVEDLRPPAPTDLRPADMRPGPAPLWTSCSVPEAIKHLQECRIELNRGQPLQAMATCKAALCNPKTRCQAQAGVAEAALLSRDVKKAVIEGEKAARCPGGGIDAHLTLGNAYLKAGRPALAREQFLQVLKTDPENRAAIQGLSQTQAGGPK